MSEQGWIWEQNRHQCACGARIETLGGEFVAELAFFTTLNRFAFWWNARVLKWEGTKIHWYQQTLHILISGQNKPHQLTWSSSLSLDRSKLTWSGGNEIIVDDLRSNKLWGSTKHFHLEQGGQKMHLLAAIKIRKNMIFLRTQSHILPSLQVLVALLCQSQLFSPEKKNIFTAPQPAAVCFFRASVLFSIENAKLWPILTNLGYFVANLCTFQCIFYRPS